MDPELKAAFDAALKANDEFEAARDKLNAAIAALVNVAASKAVVPE